MSARTELVLIPLSAHGDQLQVLVRRDPNANGQVLPHISLRSDFCQTEAQQAILRDLLSTHSTDVLDTWFKSPRYCNRIVDVYDRNLLFDGCQTIAIVRAVAIPEDLVKDVKGIWLSANNIFSSESLLSDDGKLFVRECFSLVPQWVRNTTFPFELLPSEFAIQNLRLLIAMLSNQEIDAGNFHRRLKRLDILNPRVRGQRIHRWEFAWDKANVIRSEGLIP